MINVDERKYGVTVCYENDPDKKDKVVYITDLSSGDTLLMSINPYMITEVSNDQFICLDESGFSKRLRFRHVDAKSVRGANELFSSESYTNVNVRSIDNKIWLLIEHDIEEFLIYNSDNSCKFIPGDLLGKITAFRKSEYIYKQDDKEVQCLELVTKKKYKNFTDTLTFIINSNDLSIISFYSETQDRFFNLEYNPKNFHYISRDRFSKVFNKEYRPTMDRLDKILSKTDTLETTNLYSKPKELVKK